VKIGKEKGKMDVKELAGKKIVIAPFNQEAVFVYHWLAQQNIAVIAFFDSDRRLQSENYKNIPIIPYYYLDGVVAVAADVITVDSKSIENELREVGYRDIVKQSEITFGIPFHNIADLVDIEAFVGIKGFKSAVPIKRKIAFAEKENKFNIKFISVDITNKCTLNCRYCCALMPYQDHAARKNMDINITLQSIEKVVDCVDFIPELSIIGGEPFLNPGLKDLLIGLNQDKYKRKIGNFLISTNGTIVPDKKTLQAIQGLKNHIYIYLSAYGELSAKAYDLLKICNQNEIDCVVCENKFWTPMCQPFNPDEGGYELAEALNNCSKCNFTKYNQFRIAEGKLYKCVFLAYGELGKVIPSDKRNSLDLLSEEFSSDVLQRYLEDFQPGRVYCSKCVTEAVDGEREGERVPIGEQAVSRPKYAEHE